MKNFRSSINPHQEFIETINRLIKESFGPKYSGDRHICGGSTDDFLIQAPDLELIVKPTLLDHPRYGVAGILGSNKIPHPDGSVIVVRKDRTFFDETFNRGKCWYVRAAEKYAQLYESTFSKEVKIHVVPLEDMFHVGLLSKSLYSIDFNFVSRFQ